MKKLLLSLLILPLAFASCSDDDNNGGKLTMTLKGEATSHNKIELEWSKVDGAYGYQVFYQAEGETEWETSNFRMANANDPATILWDGTFASFNAETKYTLQVKAFRDSQEGSVIAESNKIEVTTPAVLEAQIIGKWKKHSIEVAEIVTNTPEVTALLIEYLTEVAAEGDKDYIEFKTGGIFSDVFYENDIEEKTEGTYTLEDDVLTRVYGDEDYITPISISGNNLYLDDELLEDAITLYENRYKVDYPNLEITKILLLEKMVRMN